MATDNRPLASEASQLAKACVSDLLRDGRLHRKDAREMCACALLAFTELPHEHDTHSMVIRTMIADALRWKEQKEYEATWKWDLEREEELAAPVMPVALYPSPAEMERMMYARIQDKKDKRTANDTNPVD